MRCSLAVFLCLFISLLTAPLLAEGALQDGVSAYERGDYREAARILLPLAEEGEPSARNVMGRMYELGLGVEQDLKAAAHWFELGARAGNSEAQNNIAVMYSLGQGVQLSPRLAMQWYRRAADGGHAIAQYNLGVIYEEGWGVRKSDVKAMRWYRLAAAQDLQPAQHNLSLMYLSGRGVVRNHAKAIELLKRAAAHSYAPAQNDLGIMYFNGLGVAKDLVVAHLWFALAAEQGNLAAILNLAIAEDRMSPEQIAEAEGLLRAWKGKYSSTSSRTGRPRASLSMCVLCLLTA
jgi:TPR repeat protein